MEHTILLLSPHGSNITDNQRAALTRDLRWLCTNLQSVSVVVPFKGPNVQAGEMQMKGVLNVARAFSKAEVSLMHFKPQLWEVAEFEETVRTLQPSSVWVLRDSKISKPSLRLTSDLSTGFVCAYQRVEGKAPIYYPSWVE